MGTPSPDNDSTGASGRRASFSDVFDNLGFTTKIVFRPGVMAYYLTQIIVGGAGYVGLIAALVYTFDTPGSLEPGVLTTSPSTHEPLVVALASVGSMLAYFVCWTSIGMGVVRPLRDAARGDIWAVERVGQTFKKGLWAGVTAVPVIAMCYAAISVGLTALFIPGLVAAFFLAPAVYLKLTGQAGHVGAIRESIGLSRRHAGAVAAFGVTVLAGGSLLLGVVFCLNMVAFIGPLIALPVQLAAYLFFFVVYASAMLSIDAAENGWHLGGSHDGIAQVFE